MFKVKIGCSLASAAIALSAVASSQALAQETPGATSPIDISQATALAPGGKPAAGAVIPYSGRNMSAIASLEDASGTVISSDRYLLKYINTVPGASSSSRQWSAVAIVSGIPSQGCTGTLVVAFKLAKIDLSDPASVPIPKVAPQSARAGAQARPAITLTTASGEKLVEGRDYELSYSDNGESGRGRVVATALPGPDSLCSGSAEISFDVVDASDISRAEISPIGDVEYSGTPATPAVKVRLDGRDLVAGTDYDVSYEDNVKPGTAKVTVSGKGGFAGTLTTTFDIVRGGTSSTDKTNLSSASIAPISAQKYTGKAQTPALSVKIGNKTLTQGRDYTVSYSGNVNSGTAKVAVVGNGEYTGKRTETFEISKANLSSATITGVKSSYKLTGKRVRPSVSVVSGKTRLQEGRDYKVSYGKNNKTGKGSVTVTGKGNWTGSKTKSFSIKSQEFTVKFSANGGTGKMAPQKIARGKKTALRKCSFKREGYTFAGWALKEGKSKVNMVHFQIGKPKYKNKAKVRNLAKGGETITLYATWKGSGPQAACDWAKRVADDDSFFYGYKDDSMLGFHRQYGCYFCGTNNHHYRTHDGKTYDYAKSYVCMTFISAAYAHGANQKRWWRGDHCHTTYINGSSRVSEIKKRPDLKYLGKPAISSLRAGDILVCGAEHGKNHVAMVYKNKGGKCLFIECTTSHGTAFGPKCISVRKLNGGSYPASYDKYFTDVFRLKSH